MHAIHYSIFHIMMFLITAIALFCTTATATETFKNIGYLGRTYDIFYGSPFASNNFDPGFRLNIFDYSYIKQKLTDDKRYLIPDKTDIHKCQLCNVSFNSQTILGTSSYKTSLIEAVSCEFSGFEAAFTASVDFKKVSSGTSSQNSVFTDSKASCSVYCGSLFSSNLPKFENHFKLAVGRLPKCSASYSGDIGDNLTTLSFLEEYGTHYARDVKMGGRFGQKTEFTSNGYAKLASMGINVKMTAGYSGAVASGSAKKAPVVETQKAETFKKLSKKQEIYAIGGKIPDDGKSSTWAMNAIKEPMPIHYRLERLSSLLTPQNFPNDKDIGCKGEAVENAVTKYCNSLKKRNIVAACHNIDTPDHSLPPLKALAVVKKNSFEMIWWDKRSGASKDGSFWIPTQSHDEAAIGAVHAPNYNTPSQSFVNVNVTKSGNYVQKASGWDRIYFDKGTRAKVGSTHTYYLRGFYTPITPSIDGSIWRPRCKSGYTSISDFPVRHHYNTPDHYYRAYPCIIISCVSQGFPRRQWDDRHSGGMYDVTIWTVSGGDELLGADNGKNIGFFRAEPHYNYPWNRLIYSTLNKDCAFVLN